jgi:hypothetical protein
MSKIFVYYSATGNGDTVADYLKQKSYDILKLETVKPFGRAGFFKMIHFGGRATFHKQEDLKPYAFDESKYEKIVIGTPVWADRVSSPVNTFLAKCNFTDKDLAFIFYSAGGSCKKGAKEMKAKYPKATCFNLLAPAKHPDELDKIKDI